MTLYRSIFRQAWAITWQYKYLWFFGFFAALLGNGGEYEILSKGLRGDMSQGRPISFAEPLKPDYSVLRAYQIC
jgi:hypothetical protein